MIWIIHGDDYAKSRQFILNQQKGYKFKQYDPKININTFYETELKNNMDALKVIIGPIITEKSMNEASKGRYTFKVFNNANKNDIKKYLIKKHIKNDQFLSKPYNY